MSTTKKKRTQLRPLTRKQKAFADTLVKHPKMSATQAVLKTYGKEDKPLSYHTAGDIAHTNLKKPEIQLYLNTHIEKAKNTIVNLLESEKDDIRLRSAQDIIDRTYGKATQQTTSVNLNFTQHVEQQRTKYDI
jgi:phage terminase small subunit